MKLGYETVGDIAKLLSDELKAAEQAAGASVHKAGLEIKADWRKQIVNAGLGTRLSQTIRSQTYPRDKESLRSASLVWSNAPHIISAHDEGTVIKTAGGHFLAVPQPAAGYASTAKKRWTPKEWERRHGLELRPVRLRTGLILLVADKARITKKGRAVMSKAKTGRNQVTAIIFVLVPQIRLKKRIDLQRSVEPISSKVPGRIVRRWNRSSKR